MIQSDMAMILFEAYRDLQEGHWAEARQLFHKALKIQPDHPEALRGLSRIDALESIDQAVRDRIQQGDKHLQEGAYRAALDAYTQALNQAGEAGILKYHAALERKRNQARDLAGWLARTQRALDDARLYGRQGNWEAARERLDLLLQEMPESPPYATMLEQVRQERERIEGHMDAQALYNRAVEAFEADDYEQAMELAAAVPDGTSVSKRAQALCAEARRFFDRFIQPILQRAEEAYQEDRWADAAAELDQLREEYPGNPSWQRLWLQVWITHGQQELDRGRQANTARRFEEAARAFEQARQAFDKVLETHPTHTTAPGLQAEANDLHLIALDEAQVQADWQAERRKEAQAALERTLERIRRAREAGRDYATVAATVEATHRAVVTDLKRIAEEERRLQDGERLLRERRLEEAANRFRETLNALLSEHQGQAANGLSRTEAEQRTFQVNVGQGQAASDPDSAVAAFQAAYERWPTGPGIPRLLEEALVEAGETALKAGQDQKAAGYFERVLKLNEDNKRAQRGLGKLGPIPLVQSTLGEVWIRLSELQEQPEVRPEDFDPLLEKLDQVLSKARNYPELVVQLDRLREKVHQQQMNWKNYVRLAEQAERQREQGNWETALEKLRKALMALDDDWPATAPRKRLMAWQEVVAVLKAAREAVLEAYRQAQDAYKAAARTGNFAVALVPLAQAEEALRQAQEATGNVLPPDLEFLAGQVRDLRQSVEVARQAMDQYATNLADALRTLRTATALRGEDPVLSALRIRLEEEFKTHAEEASAELLRRADVAIEDGNLMDALDLLRQARELQPTTEIETRYNQLRRRKALEDRLREAEAGYQSKLATQSLPDALKALRSALNALLEPENGLPQEVRDVLLNLVMLGVQEDSLALGREEQWQTAQSLLAQIVRTGTEHWAAGRAFYFANLWAGLAREVALRGIIASAVQLGDILGAYRAAVTRLRAHPTDEEVREEHAKIRELLINRLNDSAGKRLGRAKQALDGGRFAVALDNLESLENKIYGPTDAEFPGLLDEYDEVELIRDEAQRLKAKAEGMQILHAQVQPQLEAIERNFLEGQLETAARELGALPDLRESPSLAQRVQNLSNLIARAHTDRGFRKLWDRAVASLSMDTDSFVEAVMPIAQFFCNRVGLSLHHEKQYRALYERLSTFIVDASTVFRDVRIPSDIPIVFLQGDELLESDLEDLKHVLSRVLPQPRYILFLTLFAEDERLAEARRLLDQKLRQAHARDAFILDYEQILALIGARNPRRALRQLVLSGIDLVMISPFTTIGPTPDNMFFGRERELREISEHVNIASYAIIGGRRMGKTSILGHLHRVRLPASGFRTLNYDCSTTPTYNDFLAATIRDWHPEPPLNAPATFGDLLQSPSADKPLVLLLDEADKPISGDRANSWRLFNALRALANSGRAQIVLSGERTLHDALHDSTSPLFNFPNEMLLDPLDFHAVEELVTRPMKQLEIELVDKVAIVRRIYDFTSGHPNIVQRLCHRLIERLNKQSTRRIRLDDVEAIIENTDFIRKDFLETYFSRASTLEHLCAILMAADTNLRTLTSVHEALAKSGIVATLNQVDAALERLVDLRSILGHIPAGYDFAVTAFPRIISKSKRLSDWIALRREIFVHAGDIAPETAPPELQGRLW